MLLPSEQTEPVGDRHLPAPRPLVARTLGDLLLASAARWPDSEALVFPGERLSYAELARRAWGVARSLAALGVEPRQNVGILMTNSPEFVVSLFGIAMLGAVAVPINARYRATELAFLVRDAELVAILTSSRTADYVDFAKLLAEALPGLANAPDPTALSLGEGIHLRGVLSFGSSSVAGVMDQAQFEELAEKADERRLRQWCEGVGIRNVAAIIYTSGTTSAPRGALLTHEALVRAWMMVGRRFRIGPEDRLWGPGPMFHIAALGPLVFTLGHGATYISDTYFDPERALDLIAAERPTIWYPAYPPITQALLNHPRFASTDVSSLKVWLNVAPPETLRQMAAAVPHASLISTYGSTEGGPVTLHDPDDDFEVRMSTCGAPLPGNEVCIVDPSTRARLPNGKVGEIIYRGYNTFSGYYNDPEKTADSIDAEGWVYTGDLGVIDDNGRLFFHGRLKDMLKVGGENVAPAEVEDYLGTHPAVKLVQVVGAPDPRLTEVVAAFVELHEGAQATEEELISYCQGAIASFKVPRYIRFVTEWPMSATKIQRSVLQERLARELSEKTLDQAKVGS